MKRFSALLFLIVSVTAVTTAYAQGNPPAVNNSTELKTIVVAAQTNSDAVIAVPPATSVTLSVGKKNKSRAETEDLTTWLSKEVNLNGLESSGLQPWHLVLTYDEFDEDGDNIHSGTYEEYWAGPQKFKRTYKSDNFNQTDYATDKGLFRRGDQAWPDRAQSQVRAEVLAPFFYAATLQDVHLRPVERTFGAYKLQCVAVEKNASISDPTQYCFEPDSSILRYSRGFGWFQTVYNRIVTFQNRNVAQDVDVTNGGKPYLKLRVQTLELIPHGGDADFLPPSNAVGPLGGRISGIFEMPVKTAPLQSPGSLGGQHFTVTVDIVIGKDGHVISAQGISGPRDGYKACEDSVRKWVFAPYLVLKQPVEVEEKVSCTFN